MSTAEAFEEGYDAYWVGIDSDDNPFKPGSGEFRFWNEGWSQAELENEDAVATTGREHVQVSGP